MILTNEEVDAAFKQPNENGFGKSRYDIARAIEAAALKKLKQQVPVYQLQLPDGGWIDQTKESFEYNKANGWPIRTLYAAPMPDDSLQLYNNLADEYGLSVFEDIAGLKKQRDELLASAARIVDHCDGQKNERDGIDALEQLREAIAAVRAGADRQCSAQDDAERWQ